MKQVPLLISGLPGRMALEVALAALERHEEFHLLTEALTGQEVEDPVMDVENEVFTLFSPKSRDQFTFPAGTIAVDYTTPDSALDNVKWFIKRGLPFVMGTTGYDMEEAQRLVKKSDIAAVIAPNMAIPIVMLQNALDALSHQFPNALAGYRISVTESHQSTKKDTSGTAKALVNDFSRLGLAVSVDEIEQVRDPQRQREEFNVPEEHITGHAYHFYELESEKGDLRIGLSHCVHGRRVYAEGTLHAASFLARRLREGASGEVFSMHDVMSDM